MSPWRSPSSRPSPRSPSSTVPLPRQMTTRGRPANECDDRSLHHRGHLRRFLLLPGRHGGPAALSRFAHAPARPDQGGQSRSWPDRARPHSAGRRLAGRAEARRDLGARPAGQRHDGAVHRPGVAAIAAMSVLQTLDAGVVVLVLATAAWTIIARGSFAAVVAYVAYGLLVSLVWVRLFAVDVALTE